MWRIAVEDSSDEWHKHAMRSGQRASEHANASYDRLESEWVAGKSF